MIYICVGPDSSVKTAGFVAAGASNIINRTNLLFSLVYGDDNKDKDQRSCFADKDKVKEGQEDKDSRFTIQLNRKDKTNQGLTPLTDEYMIKKSGTLNKKG